MRATAVFAAVCAVTLAALAGVFALLLRDPAARHAVLVSAVVAFAVQVAAFAAIRAAGQGRIYMAWLGGGVFRMLVLVVFGLVGAQQG